MARLSRVTKEFNLGLDTIVDFLEKNNHKVDRDMNAKITDDMYDLLKKEFQPDAVEKQKAQEVDLSGTRKAKETVSLPKEDIIEQQQEEIFEPTKVELEGPKVVGEVNLANGKIATDKKPAAAETIIEKKPIVEKVETIEKPTKVEKVEEIEEVEIPAAPIEVEDIEESFIEDTPEVVDTFTEETDTEIEPVSEPNSEPVQEEMMSVERPRISGPNVVGRIDLSSINQKTRPDPKTKEQRAKERRDKIQQQTKGKPARPDRPDRPDRPKESFNDNKKKKENFTKPEAPKTGRPNTVGETADKKTDNSNDADKKGNRRRHFVAGERVNINAPFDQKNAKGKFTKEAKPSKDSKDRHGKHVFSRDAVNTEDVDKKVRETRSKLAPTGKSKKSIHNREKRERVRQEMEAEEVKLLEAEKILKVTDVVSANDLSAMMNVPATDIIKACFEIGLMIALNQRLEADTIQMIAENFGFEVQFVSADIQEAIDVDDDKEEDLLPRSPIVTVMGHVDHGKTSLLDYIRKSNMIAGEAGGITQHIGAYSVTLPNGRKITFLDTPGHEAFTAMRARGAQVTDIAIIVVAADDNVMPQTIEAINHAAAAGVPIVFAINKIDKPGANPEKVYEQLANMNFLVEQWGGKYQCQEIAAKFGTNVEELMDKVLLEADMLELKANPNKPAQGTVIESRLDKGRGYTTNVLISSGTLRVGDVILAGMHAGKIKAMFNEREQRIEIAGPSTPVMILGLDGAPQAGDKIHVMSSEREARDIASKRERLQREQELRAMKPETLEDIARKIKIGNVQELNLILKGDVGGSVEALSDSLLKLSTEEIQIVIKHKAVGQISESDVLLASASKAIIIGFQVRPSAEARRMAEKLGIDIRLYSIIYDAIDEVKDAMTGMLSPEIKEEVIGSCEIRQVFKISKVGTIAGCYVTDGKITRSAKIRLIRDGIVIYTGALSSLKRIKDDVKEVSKGYECGLSINNYDNLNEGDIIEAFEEKEVSRTL